VPESDIVYVDSVNGQPSGSCTKAAPCNTIQLGVDVVSGSRSYVHVAPGTYPERVTINAKTLQISASGAVAAVPVGPAIEVKGASVVSIEGIRVKNVGGGASVNAVVCSIDAGNSPSLRLVGVQIDGSSGRGIAATSCTLKVANSKLMGNVGGGVSASSSDFELVNNIIVKNGGLASIFGGVLIDGNPPSGPSGATFEFNTVSGNGAQAGSASGVLCSLVGTPLVFENSIVYGNVGVDGQVSGVKCAWAYSDVGPQPATGTGTINNDPQFVDEASNNYHLKPTSPAIDAADPAASVDVDIDGEMRPAGGRSDMGADEVK
jgi:hypothetical protein